MGLEGRERFGSSCAGCHTSFPEYRCKDCTHGALWCQACIVRNHSQCPLHIVQVWHITVHDIIFWLISFAQKWNGLFFGHMTLRELGLRVQLGHAPGRFCNTFKEGNKDFVVIHTNGIHTIHLQFCCCTDVPWHTQLLHIGWYPATPLKPQTCATMDVLRQFHFLNLQGKLTGYSFYRSLEYMTDNTGLNWPPVSTCRSRYLSLY